MVTTLLDIVNVFLRWVHISSAALIVGGAVCAFRVPDGRAMERMRPFWIAAMMGLVISGLYSFLGMTGHSLRYLVLFAVKLLLAAHIFAALLMRPAPERRRRVLTGVMISGLTIFLISAYLRRIF